MLSWPGSLLLGVPPPPCLLPPRASVITSADDSLKDGFCLASYLLDSFLWPSFCSLRLSVPFPALLPQPRAELSCWAPRSASPVFCYLVGQSLLHLLVSQALNSGTAWPLSPPSTFHTKSVVWSIHFFPSRVFFICPFLLPPLRPRCSLLDYNNPYPSTVSTVVGKADLESVLMKLTVQCVHPCIRLNNF